MRSTFALAAFAAGAVAIPYAKRDYVTQVDVVYQTDVVTVYATEGQAAAPTSASSDANYSPGQHWGHGGGHWSNTWAPASTAETSSTWVAPAPTSETSTYVAPTSTYVAPTSQYVAPTSQYVAPTSSSWAAPAASTYAATDYQGITVNQHNLHRANHSSPALAWDDDLAKSAADIAASCVYAHNTEMDGGGYGQNIAAGVEPENIATIITDLFYNGEVNYYAGMYGQAQPDMTNFENWGHFSQIVWADTTHVGCATQHCPGGLGNVGSDVSPYFTVCNYKNPGNYANEYGKNIGAPLNQPTVEGNSVVVSS